MSFVSGMKIQFYLIQFNYFSTGTVLGTLKNAHHRWQRPTVAELLTKEKWYVSLKKYTHTHTQTSTPFYSSSSSPPPPLSTPPPDHPLPPPPPPSFVRRSLMKVRADLISPQPLPETNRETNQRSDIERRYKARIST